MCILLMARVPLFPKYESISLMGNEILGFPRCYVVPLLIFTLTYVYTIGSDG